MLHGDDVVETLTGRQITRPNPDSRYMYDFDYKRKMNRPWRYIGSSDDLQDFDDEIANTVRSFGLYRIVLARTGHVVTTNETKREIW